MRAKFVNEEFKEDGDPYEQLEIGSYSKKSDVYMDIGNRVRITHTTDPLLGEIGIIINKLNNGFVEVQLRDKIINRNVSSLLDLSLNESEKFEELSNDKLREIHEDDPESKDGVFAKTELKRRQEVDGEDEKI